MLLGAKAAMKVSFLLNKESHQNYDGDEAGKDYSILPNRFFLSLSARFVCRWPVTLQRMHKICLQHCLAMLLTTAL